MGEIGKLENCDRTLAKNDWEGMTIEKQWVTLDVMGFLGEKKPGGNPTDSTTVTTNVTTDRPERERPPPPQAPGGVQTYSEAPSTGIGHYLGDAERKGKYTNVKIPQGKDYK